MKLVLLALALMMVLGTSCALPASNPPRPLHVASWKAVLIAGEDQEPAFDNAVDSMAERLAEFGVPRANITILKATAHDRQAATADNIRAAFTELHPRATDACFVFVTSHGAPRRGLYLKRGNHFLSPGELAVLLTLSCGGRPTVVIASGCYSGIFAEGRSMPASNRIILTAARDDRPSFGCNANRRYTVFDACILDILGRDARWPLVMDDARRCVADYERRLNDEPSSPQLFVGAAVGDLPVFLR